METQLEKLVSEALKFTSTERAPLRSTNWQKLHRSIHRQAGLNSDAFVAEFERAAMILCSSPNLGAAWRNGRRRYGLRRFPYWVIYNVKPNELRIIAVAHQRRRPEYWRSRK